MSSWLYCEYTWAGGQSTHTTCRCDRLPDHDGMHECMCKNVLAPNCERCGTPLPLIDITDYFDIGGRPLTTPRQARIPGPCTNGCDQRLSEQGHITGNP